MAWTPPADAVLVQESAPPTNQQWKPPTDAILVNQSAGPLANDQPAQESNTNDTASFGSRVGRWTKEKLIPAVVDNAKAVIEVPNALAGGAIGMAHGYADGVYTLAENAVQEQMGLDIGESAVEAKQRRIEQWARPPKSEAGQTVMSGLEWATSPIAAGGKEVENLSREVGNFDEHGNPTDASELTSQFTGDLSTVLFGAGAAKSVQAVGRGAKAATKSVGQLTDKAMQSKAGQFMNERTQPSNMLGLSGVALALGEPLSATGLAAGAVGRAGFNKMRGKPSDLNVGDAVAQAKTDGISAIAQRVGARTANKIVSGGGNTSRTQNSLRGTIQGKVTKRTSDALNSVIDRGTRAADESGLPQTRSPESVADVMSPPRSRTQAAIAHERAKAKARSGEQADIAAAAQAKADFDVARARAYDNFDEQAPKSMLGEKPQIDGTLKQLKATAKELGMSGYTQRTKAQLTAEIEAYLRTNGNRSVSEVISGRNNK